MSDPGGAAAGTTSDGERRERLASALGLVGQRWALQIVSELRDGARRFGDLQRALGAPTNILTTRLRELQESGVLVRMPMAHNVLAYGLTDRGAALIPAIDALADWGERA